MDKIHVLQLGEKDWSVQYRIPDYVEWEYQTELTNAPAVPYDIAFLDRLPSHGEIGLLMKLVKAHTLYVTEQIRNLSRVKNLIQCKVGKVLQESEIQKFLDEEIRFFFTASYGAKFRGRNLAVSPDFHGAVTWQCGDRVTLQGEFGEPPRQVLFWRNNIKICKGQTLEFWLEYGKTESVTLTLKITQLAWGQISEKKREWEFSEEDMQVPVIIDSPGEDTLLFVSILAKGSGELQVHALHHRLSRGKYGTFLPGGERYVASNREEVFCYFDPGDRKPPLNVFFSGYKTGEGFEGMSFMRKMEAPFLLISESRLEGGAFYMGTPEYESLFVKVIQRYVEELGFQRSEVVLSGIAMGSFGALYFGCDVGPHALILGKPIVSIGNVASNETYHRPGGFPASMDVLMLHGGSTTDEAVELVNQRFWDKFDRTDWGESKFVVAYMLEDDYDRTSYQQILSHLHGGGVQVYGKGFHGRHNDATKGIVQWFEHQYRKILTEDFGRKLGDEW